MNERIRELAQQAGFQSYITTHEEDVAMFEKFAELIVAECIDVFSKDLPDPTSPDYQIGSLPEVVNRIANVTEHFGVEE